MPVDKNDISKGWVALEIPELDDGMTNGRAVKKGSVLNQSPLGAGLKDGAMLAFKFRKQDAGADDLGMDLDDDWDVIMPSYDDEGSQSQGRV